MNGFESFGNAQILLYQEQARLARALLSLLSGVLRRRQAATGRRFGTARR